MARFETRSITVGPQEEQATIEKFEKFGWDCQSSQTVDVKDSHLERKDDDLYSITEHTNYVKLVFKRDRDMVGYRQIVDCENRYDALLRKEPHGHRWNIALVPGIAIVVLAILMIVTQSYRVGILFLVVGAALTFLGAKIRNSANEKYDSAYRKWRSALDSISEEAGRYLESR